MVGSCDLESKKNDDELLNEELWEWWDASFQTTTPLEEHIQQIIHMHKQIVVFERILLNGTQNLKIYNEFATSYGNFMEFSSLNQRIQNI